MKANYKGVEEFKDLLDILEKYNPDERKKQEKFIKKKVSLYKSDVETILKNTIRDEKYYVEVILPLKEKGITEEEYNSMMEASEQY